MHVRSLLAIAVAALLAGPAAAHAQSKKSSQAKAAPAPATAASTSSPQLSIAGWIGYETGDLDGLQLRVDGVLPIQKLSPQVELSFVGSIGYSYLTHSVSAFGVGTDTTANVLKFVPAARFTLPVNPQLSFYGDAGLGLYWASVSTEVDYGLGVTTSGSSSDVGLMFRFGIGGFYKLNPKTQLGLSIYLDPMLGGYNDTTFTIMAGAQFGT
jgi:opacity protein-like surface antigen